MWRLIVFFITMLAVMPVGAEDIKLVADKQVEYHQKEQKLVAVGNAIASKGNVSIRGDRLVGYYAPELPNKISRVEATGNVAITSAQAKAWGNKATYDVKEATAVLMGGPARVKTAEADITAKGSITFWKDKQQALAKDDVTATNKNGNKVQADQMRAYFTKDKSGKLVLEKIDINGNVKINAKDTEITAVKGTYQALNGKIELFDDITIKQNGNVLHGKKAETNLNTGISRIISGPQGRVSGVFKETKKEKDK